MRLVPGGVHKRDRSLLVPPLQVVEQVALLIEFRLVSPAELVPPLGVVVVPRPQIGAGGDLLSPVVDRRRLFVDTSGPEPFDQDAGAVIPARWLVDPLQPDRRP